MTKTASLLGIFYTKTRLARGKLKIITLLLSLILLGIESAFARDCLVIHNIKGVTPTLNSPELEAFRWLAIADGKVIGKGSNTLDKALNTCEKHDGKQSFLLPGLIDAHGHVSALGNELLQVQLRGVTSEANAAMEVKIFEQENPATKWILGRGWNQVLWKGKRFPTRQSLDALNIDKPIVLERVDAHAVWINSIALKKAGINADTPDPEGGKIERDSQGVATGVLIDNAISLISDKMPQPTQEALDRTFDKAYSHLLSLGVTSVHDAGVSKKDFDAYFRHHASGQLPVRIYGMLSGTSPYLDSWLKQGPVIKDDDRLSIRSVKLYSDGALGSRGAALLAPYSDDPDNTGLLLTPPKELEILVEKIMESGFQANVHAIGDKGNRLVLNTFEKTFKRTKGKALRNRIEHAQVVSPEDIPRFKTLDIIASMQPTHATSDKNMAGDRIGEARLKGAYAWQTFLNNEVTIASGSDFPVEYANPFFGLHAAVTRQDMENEPKGGWLAHEKMTRTQALRSFTIDAAFAGHQETVIGSLEKGKWADFILVDQDFMTASAEDIWKTKVLETWIAGEKKYTYKK